MAFLTKRISPETVKADPHTDTDINTQPTEFSELEVKKSTGKQKLEAIYRIILENPTIKSWFLASFIDSAGKQRKVVLSADEVTNFVKNLLVFINDLDLGKCLEEELRFYVDKILKRVTGHEDISSESDGDSIELLTHVLKFLDTTTSISVLESVLEKPRESSGSDGSLILVTKHIVDSLCNKTRLSIYLTDNCVNDLVKLTCSSEDTSLMQSVICLFKKFPNLSVLCSGENLTQLLQKHTETPLVEILMSNNINLRTHIESWFMRKPKWMKENRKKILPLVKRLLRFHTMKSGTVKS